MSNLLGFLLLLVVFAGAFIAIISTDKPRRLLALIVAVSSGVVVMVIDIVALLAKQYDSRAPNFSLLLVAVSMWAIILARPALKRQIGVNVIKIRRLTPTGFMTLLVVPVFLFLAWTSAQPHRRSDIDGQPIFDGNYFTWGRASLFVSTVTMAAYFLTFAMETTEFLTQGITQNGGSRRWSEFNSYRWETNTNTSFIDLVLNPQKRTLWTHSIRISVELDYRAEIEDLLRNHLQPAA